VSNSKICLSGFSQGCMMSINIGLTSNENFNCVVGFSGKIIDKDHLSKRISSQTKMLLLHGELDTIVPASNLLDIKDFLLRNKIEVETHMISNCDHHIPIKASSIALNYIKKNFLI
jgi:phospholipase/carboxylesterase